MRELKVRMKENENAMRKRVRKYVSIFVKLYEQNYLARNTRF